MTDGDRPDAIANRLAAGHTLLVVGTGPDAALALRVSARLAATRIVVRPLTADASTLTAIANDYGFEQVYARQVEALAHEGDVLLIVSTGAQHTSLVEAAKTAASAGVHVVTVTGTARTGAPGGLAPHLEDVIEAILTRQSAA